MGPCNSNNKKSRPHHISSMKNKDEQAILQCKIARDKIKEYIKRLERNSNMKKEKAILALRSKDRKRAKLYLSQSKVYAEQAKSATGQLHMIEDQIVQIESATQMRDAVKVLENGNKVLKSLYEEVNVEKWEQIGDDLNELKAQQEEIGNFLKNRNIDQVEYDEEINKEIEDMLRTEAKEITMDLPAANKKYIQQGTENQTEEESPIAA